MNGILLIDKQQDWTSNDVVSKLRGILRERRIGHSGTLDPLATGLLVVFVGRATRAVEFAESDNKRYIAHLRLGLSTDTQDITGKTLRESEANINDAQLEAVLSGFRGEIEQVPPMYSAIKVNGQRLYDIARRGGDVERQARRLFISRLEIIGREGEDYVLDICCSKGTYIRTLCNDIGDALGCGGCMAALRRSEAGIFRLANAYTLDEVQKAADKGEAEALLLPTDSLFKEFPSHTVTAAAERKIRCGNQIKTQLSPGKYRLYSESLEFLALASSEQGMLKTVKSFFEV